MKKIILSIFLAASFQILTANPLDSIDQKIINGKRYIVYKVEKAETLYSLSKKYNCTVEDINAANNGLKDGLKLGANVFIPAQIQTSTAKVPTVTNTPVKNVAAIHLVSAGETLYAIAKKYNVTVDQIKEWNKLTLDEVTVGQELKLSGTAINVIKPGFSANPPIVVDKAKPYSSEPDKTIAAPPTIENPEPVKNYQYKIDSAIYGEDVTESKKVEKLIETGVDQDKNLAQYPGVKIGTILMVVNPVNNKATFVRVVSNNTSGNIALTTSVLTSLGLSSDGNTKANVSYTK